MSSFARSISGRKSQLLMATTQDHHLSYPATKIVRILLAVPFTLQSDFYYSYFLEDINYNSVELAEEESDEKLYISNENPGPSDDKSGQESSPSQSYGLMTPTPTKTLPGKEVRSVVQLHCTKWPGKFSWLRER